MWHVNENVEKADRGIHGGVTVLQYHIGKSGLGFILLCTTRGQFWIQAAIVLCLWLLHLTKSVWLFPTFIFFLLLLYFFFFFLFFYGWSMLRMKICAISIQWAIVFMTEFIENLITLGVYSCYEVYSNSKVEREGHWEEDDGKGEDGGINLFSLSYLYFSESESSQGTCKTKSALLCLCFQPLWWASTYSCCRNKLLSSHLP